MAFPLLLIPLAICNIIVFLMPDLALSGLVPLFSITLMSRDIWAVTLNDVIVALSILLLLLEVTRAARPAAKYFTDHFLSLVVFGAAAAEFVMLPKFGNSTFFMVALVALVDFFAGISLRARRPRRVVAEPVRAEPAPRFEPAPVAPVPATVAPVPPVVEAAPVTAEPKFDARPAAPTETPAVPPEVIAHTSPQITSPDLQPGTGVHPSNDTPPTAR